MVRVIVPACIIESFSIIIPIAKWDIFEGFDFNPKNWYDYSSDQTYGYGVY